MKKIEDKKMKEFYDSNSNRVETLKKSNWKIFEDFVGVLFIAIFLIILLIVFTVLCIYIIENPISLAILCVTILLLVLRGMEKW